MTATRRLTPALAAGALVGASAIAVLVALAQSESGPPPPEPVVIGAPLFSSPKVIVAALYFQSGGPLRLTGVPLPLLANREDDAAVLRRLAAWIREGNGVASPPDRLAIGTSYTGLSLRTADGQTVTLTPASDCKVTGSARSCATIPGAVDAGHGTQPFNTPADILRFDMPALSNWILTGWQSDLRLGSRDEVTEQWQRLPFTPDP